MTADKTKRARDAGEPLIRSSSLAAGSGWKINEYVCLSGPGDAVADERHNVITVAAVVEGSFVYHGDSGRHLMHPGALLAGNHGRCYSCGHDHGAGDRCIALHIDSDLFAEIAATATSDANFRFPIAMLPATAAFAPFMTVLLARDPRLSRVKRTEKSAAVRDDEIVVTSIASLLRSVSGHVLNAATASRRDEARVARALAVIDERLADDLDLATLAAAATMSKFHFLRTFRKVTGTTPHGYILARRLSRAASRLAVTDEKVSTIAFAEGVPDLSTFNRQFRVAYGEPPSSYRKNHRRRAR